MAIRLTESRLRQIIREEAGKLNSTKGRKSLRESAIKAALDAAFDENGYDGLVDMLYKMDPNAEDKMSIFCHEGDVDGARAYLQDFFAAAGIESENEDRLLDAIGERLGVDEFSMMGYDF